MSVLNKMLRDLEQRQPDASANYSAERGIALPARSRKSYWLLALMLLVLCLLLYLNANSTITVLAEAETAADTPLLTETKPALPAVIELSQPSPQDQPKQSGQQRQMSTEETDTPFITSTKQTEAEPVTLGVVSQPAASTEVMAATAPAAIAEAVENTKPLAAVSQAEASTSNSAGTEPVQVERTALTLTQRQDVLQQQAIAAAQAGQLRQALSLWQQVQQLEPQAVDAYLAQAGLWMQLAQPFEAEKVLLQGVQQGISSAELQLLLAQHFAARSDWQQVDVLLSPQFNLTQHPEYYGLKATALQQLGQQSAALHWFRQLIVQQPQQARWWLGAAIAFDAQGQREQAQQHFRQALHWGGSLSAASRNYIQQRLGATE